MLPVFWGERRCPQQGSPVPAIQLAKQGVAVITVPEEMKGERAQRQQLSLCRLGAWELLGLGLGRLIIFAMQGELIHGWFLPVARETRGSRETGMRSSLFFVPPRPACELFHTIKWP